MPRLYASRERVTTLTSLPMTGSVSFHRPLGGCVIQPWTAPANIHGLLISFSPMSVVAVTGSPLCLRQHRDHTGARLIDAWHARVEAASNVHQASVHSHPLKTMPMDYDRQKVCHRYERAQHVRRPRQRRWALRLLPCPALQPFFPSSPQEVLQKVART
jgi:hypothetical protein